MTVDQIANKVAWYFQKTRSDFVDAGGEDMIISAMNWTRLDAERVHDFAVMQGMASMSIDPASGGDITAAYVLNGDTVSTTVADIKSVIGAYLQDQQQSTMFWPLVVNPKKLLNIQAKEINYRYRGVPSAMTSWDVPLVRYPDDARNYASSRPFTVYWQGSKLFLDPRPSTAWTCRLDCNMWCTGYMVTPTVHIATSDTSSTSITLVTLPSGFGVGSTVLGRTVASGSGTSWTLNGNANQTIASDTVVDFNDDLGDSYSDFFTERASDYLLYGAIVHINYFSQKFVSRAEGFLSPPEKLRDKALATLIEWDNFMWEQAYTPLYLRQ